MASSSTSSMTTLEQLLAYLQSGSEEMGMLHTLDPSRIEGLSFMSMITYEGVPILPPVINPLGKEEVLIYKRQSLMAEQRLRSKTRQSLLEKMQLAMDEIEEKHVKNRQSQEADCSETRLSFKAADNKNLSNGELISFETDTGVSSISENLQSSKQQDPDTLDESDLNSAKNHSADLSHTAEVIEQILDDSDLQFPDDASQGLLMLRKKLEERSKEATSTEAHLVLSMDKSNISKLSVTDALKSEKLRISSDTESNQQQSDNAVENAESASDDSKQERQSNKTESVAKRLPTFLRIQESLTRKLNSTLGSQTSQSGGLNSQSNNSQVLESRWSENSLTNFMSAYSMPPSSNSDSLTRSQAQVFEDLQNMNKNRDILHTETNKDIENSGTEVAPESDNIITQSDEIASIETDQISEIPRGRISEVMETTEFIPVVSENSTDNTKVQESKEFDQEPDAIVDDNVNSVKSGNTEQDLNAELNADNGNMEKDVKVTVSSISTSNSMASGNTFGSDDLNKTVISQEESKSKNTTSGTMQSEDSVLSPTPQTSQNESSSKPEISSEETHDSKEATGSSESNNKENTDSSGGLQHELQLRSVPTTPPHENNKENLNPKLTLLGKVALALDQTPDCTPHKGRVEQFFAQPSPDTWISKVSTEDKYPLENINPVTGAAIVRNIQVSEIVPSPDPSKTPNLSEISYADSTDPLGTKMNTDKGPINVKQVSDNPNSHEQGNNQEMVPDVADYFAQSLDTHDLFTESTDLAQYMAGSQDTMQSTVTTLPHFGEEQRKAENQYSGANQSHNHNQTMPKVGMTPGKSKQTLMDIRKQIAEASTPKDQKQDGYSPGLRGSYTLERPSPALVASHALDIAYDKNQGHNVNQGQGENYRRRSSSPKDANMERAKSQLTSSMEDLNIRAVHRKLEYQPEKPSHRQHPIDHGTENLIITPLPAEDESEQGQSHADQGHHIQAQGQMERIDIEMPLDVLQQDQREAERHGKQEHLQRYLDNLTAPPVMVVGDNAGQQVHGFEGPYSEDYVEPGGDDEELEAETRHIEEDNSDEGFANENGPSAEELIELQHITFERQRKQLIEEHQQQLMQLQQQQEQQQQLYQQQLLKTSQPAGSTQHLSQEKRTRSRQSNRKSGDAVSHLPDTSISQPTSQPPSINQNQLLASLAQLLGQQNLSTSFNAQMSQSLPQHVQPGSMPSGMGNSHGVNSVGAMNADPSQFQFGGHQSLPDNPQNMPGLLNSLQNILGITDIAGRQNQMSQGESGRFTNNVGSPQQSRPDSRQLRPDSQQLRPDSQQFRPDSQLSSVSTLTLQDFYHRNTDGTVSQASTMQPDYSQRPYSAPVPHMNYSMDGGAGIQSPGGPGGLQFSPSAIANLLAQVGLNVSQNADFSSQQNSYSHHQNSPQHRKYGGGAAYGSPANQKRSPLPLPNQAVFQHQNHLHGNLADTSINSSERSVHFASPVHVTAHVPTVAWEQSMREGEGDVSRHDYSYQQHYHYNNSIHHQEISPEMHEKFVKLTALVKGYLVRRLLKTEKIQSIIKSISDTAEFALKFTQESPIKRGVYSEQDKRLQERVLQQLTANMYEIHDIFFRIPVHERMEIIQADRRALHERQFKAHTQHIANEKKLSKASVKYMERKQKAMLAEASVPPTSSRPKSAPPPVRHTHRNTDERALKPLQTRTTPIKPLKNTNRVQHKDPNIKTAPRKTHVQTRPASTNKNKSKQTVTSTAAKKSNVPVKQPVRKIARSTGPQTTTNTHIVQSHPPVS